MRAASVEDASPSDKALKESSAWQAKSTTLVGLRSTGKPLTRFTQ